LLFFEDAFYLSQSAFNLADKHQIPVFILSDQYFADVIHNHPTFDLMGLEIEDHVIKTDSKYQRYEITENGISPRGIPGFGKGLVVVDSDEHDEEGHLTENLDMRTKMVDKRLEKMDGIRDEIVEPELIGNLNYKTLVIGWGSTYGPIAEAVKNMERDDISFLHFKQVYPLHHNTLKFLKMENHTIIFENNAQGQFSDLIKLTNKQKEELARMENQASDLEKQLDEEIKKGDILVNNKPITEFFPSSVMRYSYSEPFRITNTVNK